MRGGSSMARRWPVTWGSSRGNTPAGHGSDSVEAKIKYLGPSIFCNEHIFGLEVAMNDSLLVRRGKPHCDLHPPLNRVAHRQRTQGKLVAQSLSFEELSRHVSCVIASSSLIDHYNIRMIEHCCC